MFLPEDLHPYNYSYYISRLEGPSELQEVFLEASILYTKQCVQLIHRSEKHFILYEQYLKEEDVKIDEKKGEANKEGDKEGEKEGDKEDAKESEKLKKDEQLKADEKQKKDEKIIEGQKLKKDEKIIEGQISCITINSDDEPEIKFCRHKSIQVRFENTLHFFITSNALCFTILQNEGVFTCLSRLEDDICYMYTVFTTKKIDPNYFLEVFKSPRILLKDFEILKNDGVCFGDNINEMYNNDPSDEMNNDPSDEINNDGRGDDLTEKYLSKLKRDDEAVNQMYKQDGVSIARVNEDLNSLKVRNTFEMQDTKQDDLRDKANEDIRIVPEDEIQKKRTTQILTTKMFVTVTSTTITFVRLAMQQTMQLSQKKFLLNQKKF